MDVGTALGIDVKEQDISAAHRVPSYNSKRNPALIVQFVSRTFRDVGLNRYTSRENRELTAHKVNASFPKHNVDVNEQGIFILTESEVKDVGYGIRWCRDGKFFVCKAERDRFQRIDTFENIDQLK